MKENQKFKACKCKPSIRNLLIVCFILFLCIAIPSQVAKADTITFDSSGNLVYVTHAGKDTTGVKYRTIGWIIKRYDMPLDAPGQQYVIIPKTSNGENIPDPLNPAYVYVYFRSSSSEITSAISRVSTEWKNQLLNYGGMVYIDSVMTVNEYGVIRGNVDSNGKLSGEVYTTYKGIAGARGWGYPPELMGYYDIKVMYPSQVKKPEPKYTITSTKQMDYKSSIFSDLHIGSYRAGEEKYNITQGIPGGETIYISGSVSKYYYETRVTWIKGYMEVPVPVTTTYIMNWKDYQGVSHSETQKVTRWYAVRKNFEYYDANSANAYGINQIELCNASIETGKYEKNIGMTAVGTSIKNYGSVASHVNSVVSNIKADAGTVILNSTNHLKPNIPNVNQKSIAKAAVSGLMVKSDRITIAGKDILSDTVSLDRGSAPVYLVPEKYIVNNYGIQLDKTVVNGDYLSKCSIKHLDTQENKIISTEVGIEDIRVHTPVVCNGAIICGKMFNQDVEPVENTIILGKEFTVSGSTYGYHSELRGYGYGIYEKFIGEKMVSFPFDVKRGEIILGAGTWIDLNEGATFTVPQYVSMGDYEIDYRYFAINAKTHDVAGEEGANTSINSHMAYGKSKVRVSGRLFGFTVRDEKENVYYVGNRDENGRAREALQTLLCVDGKIQKAYELSIIAVGEYEEGDEIAVRYSYRYLEDGREEPVNVYIVNSRNAVDQGDLKRAPQEEILEINIKEELETGVAKYSWNYELGDEMYILPQDIEVSDIKQLRQEIEKSEIQLENGSLLISVEIETIKNETPFISYINENNAPMGYCNMWKTEGFRYNQNIADGVIRLLDGDAILIGIPKEKFYDYRVVGTH